MNGAKENHMYYIYSLESGSHLNQSKKKKKLSRGNTMWPFSLLTHYFKQLTN